MDFPISVPSIGLVDGKFVDEDPLGGAPGSLIPAQWGNAVTEELLAVIQAAGLAPDEEDNAQLLQAISAMLVTATPEATETVLGLVKHATQLQVDAGTNDTAVIAPKKLATAVQNQTLTAFTTAGTAIALTLTPTPAIQAYAPYLRFSVKFSVTGGLNPTLNVSTKGPKSLKQYDSTGTKVAAAFVADQISDVVYDGTDWVVLDPLPQAVGLGFRNKFANGAFRTNQRGYASGTALAAGVPSTGVGYGHDGFRAGSGGMTYTFTQSLGPTQISITAGTGIMTAEDASIDGGAYVLSWTGTAQARVGINNAAPSGSYVASPILISSANAGQAIAVEFNTGTVGTIQLESGTIKTPFEWSDPQSQLARCQRYLPVVGPSSTGVNGVIASGQCITTQQAVFPIPLKVTPRTTLTGLIVVNPTSFQASNATYVGATTSSVILYGTTSNSMVGVQVVTSGAALVAGNASTLISVAAGAQLIFTGAEI